MTLSRRRGGPRDLPIAPPPGEPGALDAATKRRAALTVALQVERGVSHRQVLELLETLGLVDPTTEY